MTPTHEQAVSLARQGEFARARDLLQAVAYVGMLVDELERAFADCGACDVGQTRRAALSEILVSSGSTC